MLAALAVVVGALIGMVGVGGVLLPPALVVVGGLDPHQATATSTWAFVITGLVGTVAYARRGLVPWGMLGHQAVQFPVVLSGSAGYLPTGLVDVPLGTGLGLVAGLGVVGGAALATRLQADGLRRVVSLACIVTGVVLLVRVPSSAA